MLPVLRIFVCSLTLSLMACGGQPKGATSVRMEGDSAQGHLGQICLPNETCQAPWRCYAGECRHPCAVSRACAFQGDCAPHPEMFWSQEQRSWAIKPYDGMEFKVGFDVSETGALSKMLCRPNKPLHCASSQSCVDRGQCAIAVDPNDPPQEGSITGGKAPKMGKVKCRATKPEHCAQSKKCARSGKCTLALDETFTGCIKGPLDDGFCKKTRACKKNGACSAGPDHRCVVKTKADCESSEGCKMKGECQPREGRCVVQSADACAQSFGCTIFGLCDLVDGVCAPSKSAHCTESKMCSSQGKCGLRNGSCVPTSAEHCQGMMCQMFGLCAINEGGYCEGSPSICAEHDLCKRFGLCAAKQAKEIVVHSGRKQASQRFPQARMVCAIPDGFDCSKTTVCERKGGCSLDTNLGGCRALSDADCAKCPECVEKGKTHAEGGRCKRPKGAFSAEETEEIPEMPEGMDAECAKDRQCTKGGRCTATFIPYTGRWGCNPSSTEHCAQSRKCKTDGLCAFDKDIESGPGCVPDPARCPESEACKQRGHCAATKHACRPSLTRHCSDSDVCKTEDRCTLHPGEDAYSAECVKNIPSLDGRETP